MAEVKYRGRRAAAIENGQVRVTVTVEGGHVAEMLNKETGVNPLWTPPWPSIEPSSYSFEKHPEYGHDAESRFTPKGTSYTRFSLATGVSWKDQASDEYRTRTEWHQIVVWGRLGVWAGSLKKGSFVEVEGEVRYREYQPKGSDAKARAAEVHAKSILTLDRAEKADRSETIADEPSDGDTPF